jgi:hypothetical protein
MAVGLHRRGHSAAPAHSTIEASDVTQARSLDPRRAVTFTSQELNYLESIPVK